MSIIGKSVYRVVVLLPLVLVSIGLHSRNPMPVEAQNVTVSGTVVERLDLRTKNARFFEKTDGTIYADIYLGPSDSESNSLSSPQEDTGSSADCYVSSWNPNVAQPSQDHLYVGFNDYYSKGQTRAYLKFNLPALPIGYQVASAELRMYFYAWQGTNSLIVNIYRVTSDWSESGVTWNSQPSIDSTVRGSTSVTKSSDWKVWTITSLVQDWYNGTTNRGISVRANSENEYGGTFYSTVVSPKVSG